MMSIFGPVTAAKSLNQTNHFSSFLETCFLNGFINDVRK